MQLNVVKIFDSIQGEGIHIGKPVTFLRLGGCNQQCSFCDTKHTEFKSINIDEVFNIIKWKYNRNHIVITGGEPLIQAKSLFYLLEMLQNERETYRIDLETNGTLSLGDLHQSFSTITVSPKVKLSDLHIEWQYVNVLKLIFPYIVENIPDIFDRSHIPHKYISPVNDRIQFNYNLLRAAYKEIIRLNEDEKIKSRWGLTLQLHKLIGTDICQ